MSPRVAKTIEEEQKRGFSIGRATQGDQTLYNQCDSHNRETSRHEVPSDSEGKKKA